MKVLTDGQVKEINSFLEQIKKSTMKGEAVLCVISIEAVLLRGENAVLTVSCREVGGNG